MKLRQAIENEVPPGFELVSYRLDVTVQGQCDHYQGTTECKRLNSDGSSVVRSHDFLAVVDNRSGDVVDAMPLGKPRMRLHVAPPKIEAEQVGLDEVALMRSFDQLDYSNLDQLVKFFYGMISDNGIERGNAQRIVDGFTEHGYLAGVNCGDEFDTGGRENYGRYVIGQALAFLDEGYLGVYVVHPVLRWHFERWLSSFGSSHI